MAQPKKINWPRAYMVAGLIDAAQIGIDFIPLVGEIANEILDIAIEIGMNIWAWRKGLLDLTNFIIIFSTGLIEEATVGAAPLWIGDIAALHKRSPNMLAVVDAQEIQNIPGTENGPLYQEGRRLPTGRARPVNNAGSRIPIK